MVLLSETSREWRWGHEQKGWAWINGRESGLSHAAGWDFCCFSPRVLCCPWLLSPIHQPMALLPQGLQVDPGGREGSAAVSVSHISPLSCPDPVPLTSMCSFRYYHLSLLLSAELLEGIICTHYLYPCLSLPPFSFPGHLQSRLSCLPVASPWWHSSSHACGG